jgi:non-ribosomal peptide synthase protein (TIGR01720 family)
MTNFASFDNHRTGLEIAIIGMAGRFPGARTVEAFWQNLRNGVESISFFFDEELESMGIATSVLHHPNYVKAGGVLDEWDLFDASFFGFSAREATIMDPQQRLFLECAWEALERAGYDPERYAGLIGVYAGASMNTYAWTTLYPNYDLVSTVGEFQTMLGNDKDYLTTRVSYRLNLRGPSVVVQTACSTSLVAVHLACQGLLGGECDLALAGGVSVRVPHKAGYFYQEAGIDSPDGHCRPFDAKASGTVNSSGAGIVVLKRLEDALADNDMVYALIKGSAVNNDGAQKIGYTAPSVGGQVNVIRAAQLMAEVEPETITYIEAHGTGTKLGDPIELAALKRVFDDSTDKRHFCAIGSVKSNIGHLNAAAGIAGLIKTVLSLYHGQLPPSLNFEQLNPNVDLTSSALYINSALTEWQRKHALRRAGVSSFGIGGTNAHVILEEAPSVEDAGEGKPWQLLVLSAKSDTALNTTTTNLRDHLMHHPDLNMADVAYTLQVGRAVFDHRRTVVCHDLADAVTALTTLDPEKVFSTLQPSRDRSIIFMFPGQGAQYVNMGRGLYEREPLFRNTVDYCIERLKVLANFDLRHLLYPSEHEEQAIAAHQLDQTLAAQLGLFIIEYALAKLCWSWGIKPKALVGHSVGEYVAACLAGVFDLDEGLELVAARGQLMQSMPPGSMLSVLLAEDRIRPLLIPPLTIAAVNSPSHCVVAGPTPLIDAFAQQLAGQSIPCRKLHTSHAFHSPMMSPIVRPFAEVVARIQLREPQIPYIANITGAWVKPDEATNPEYWAQHLRQPVQFSSGVDMLTKEMPDSVFLEVGPGRTLCGLVSHHSSTAHTLHSMRQPHNQTDDRAALLQSLGRLWLAGVPIDWKAFHNGQRRRVLLPTYPFERRKYWAEANGNSLSTSSTNLFKNPDITHWFYIPSWKRTMPPSILDAKVDTSCWLFFGNGSRLSRKCVRQLKQYGLDIVIVEAGERFEANNRHYLLNPKEPGDYERLLADLTKYSLMPNHIVHMWTVNSSDQVRHDSTEKELVNGFYSLMYLSQALDRHQAKDSYHLTVISSNTQKVNSHDLVYSEKATLLGACRVIPQQMPQITCCSIDVHIPEAESSYEAELVKQLTAEFMTHSPEQIVAYRGDDRLVQTFEPTPLAEIKEAVSGMLRHNGVYLLTDGFNGLGLILAEYLAQTVQAKLVLINPTPLPARAVWEEWLTEHEASTQINHCIRTIQRLETLGTQVLVIQAELAKRFSMETAIQEILEEFGTLRGVIHTPGMPSATTYQQVSEGVLTEKVYETQVLEAVLQDLPLDFFMLCYPLSAAVGKAGQAEDSAVAAFFDAFASEHQRHHSKPIMSVNWDMETFTDGQTILPEEIAEAFVRLLRRNRLSQITICPRNLPILLTQAGKPSPRIRETDVIKQWPPESPYSDSPRNDIERKLAMIWQQLLGVDQIGIHDDFFEAGGDSLISIQLAARAKDLGILLTSQQVLTARTISGLATVATSSNAVEADQIAVIGEFPLLPIQQWCLDLCTINPHHWNLAMMFELTEVMEATIIEKALKYLLKHHDMLRLRMTRRNGNWQPYIPAPDEKTPFSVVDLSNQRDDRHEAGVKAAVIALQTSLNLETGPLLRVVLFDFGPQQPSQLLIIIHHIVTDAVSLTILIQDFTKAYQQLAHGRPIQLPAKTTSYKAYAERLAIYARSKIVRQEVEYWLTQCSDELISLPIDYPNGKNTNTADSSCMLDFELDWEETQFLWQVPRFYNMRMEELLLAALAQAVVEWTDERRFLLIDLLYNGRQPHFEDVDLSRTVGWLTFGFPLLLNLRQVLDTRGLLEDIRNQFNRIPGSPRGMNYSLLRYMNDDKTMIEKLQALPQAEILFNYIGRLDGVELDSGQLKRLDKDLRPLQEPKVIRSYLLEVVVSFGSSSALRAEILYSKNVHKQETVEKLGKSYIGIVRRFIDYHKANSHSLKFH